MTRQFHRPARLDPETAESIEGAADTASSSELAHRAAQALIGGRPSAGGRSGDPDVSSGAGAPDDPGEWITRSGVVAAVASHGVDTVAELWADSPATTLPGTLWRLFLVREWIRRDPALVARRYATVIDLSALSADADSADSADSADGTDSGALSRFEAARVEARPVPSPEDLRAALDRVLAGEMGDVASLAPILRTTAAFLRALAVGSDAVWIDDDADELADRVTRRDSALLATAGELIEASRRAASGRLD